MEPNKVLLHEEALEKLKIESRHLFGQNGTIFVERKDVFAAISTGYLIKASV